MQKYNSTYMTTAWMNSCFILSEKSDFHFPVNCSSCFSYAFVDIAFSRGDITTEVFELVYQYQRLAI